MVTQTSSLVDVAQQAKDDPDGKTAQQGSYLNVPVSGVRILCLSRDELTLAACVGDRTVHIYDVPTLVHKVMFARSYACALWDVSLLHSACVLSSQTGLKPLVHQGEQCHTHCLDITVVATHSDDYY